LSVKANICLIARVIIRAKTKVCFNDLTFRIET